MNIHNPATGIAYEQRSPRDMIAGRIIWAKADAKGDLVTVTLSRPEAEIAIDTLIDADQVQRRWEHGFGAGFAICALIVFALTVIGVL